MIHKIFSIFDQKAKAYLPPFVLPEVGMATRTFADCVNSEEHQFGRHPGDYTLMELGTWDDSTCNYELSNPIKSLGTGLMFIVSSPLPDLQEYDETALRDEASVLSGAKS